MELVRLKEVSKEFGKHRVLEDINLTIERGDILGIIGQSGSGKTTLLNMLTGFLEPTEGQVLYSPSATEPAKDLNKHIHKIKKDIGFTPQHNSFYPKLTVEENLNHFGKLYGVKKDTLKNNMNSLLQFTELSEHKEKLAEQLSGGMQKRLDISCSLIHKPKLLVLDEPTADLDPILQKEIIKLLEEVNKQGVTVVIASHHLDQIEHLCTKVAIVHQAKIRSFGSMDHVREPFLKDQITINMHPGENKQKILSQLRKFPIEKIVDKGDKLIIYPGHTEKTVNGLMTFIQSENMGYHDLDLRKPSLGEIFERIVKGE
ncbi:ABC transporter ATP-binding protein [Candidatus Woesearchaeota archaeon]|nr:ABC transporter ATP-binding protein [Candidatus Woesearchaeota archaeon]